MELFYFKLYPVSVMSSFYCILETQTKTQCTKVVLQIKPHL